MAIPAYLWIKDDGGADIKGAVDVQNREGSIEVQAPWNYKTRIGRQYENFGNFHYGAVGTAAGISSPVLLRAAGWAQSKSGNGQSKDGHWYGSPPFGDDPTDQFWIKCGIDYATRTGF